MTYNDMPRYAIKRLINNIHMHIHTYTYTYIYIYIYLYKSNAKICHQMTYNDMSSYASLPPCTEFPKSKTENSVCSI